MYYLVYADVLFPNTTIVIFNKSQTVHW